MTSPKKMWRGLALRLVLCQVYFVVHRQLATSILDLRSDDRDSILADLDEAHENVLDVQISVDSIRMQKYGGCIQYRDGEIHIDMHTHRYICLKV